VLLYTDGLVERREDASIDDGLERLLAAAGELAGAPLSELCDRLLDLLGTTGSDDIALLALRAYPEDLPRPTEAGPRIVPGDHAGSTD
jgi:serine phosphatase RsbU (regulator of sigma subunit)